MAIFLMLPGSPIPDWLVFLAPVVALLLLIQGAQSLRHWYKQRLAHHHPEQEQIAEDNGNNT